MLNRWFHPAHQVGPSCSTEAPLDQQVRGPLLLNSWPSCSTGGPSCSTDGPSCSTAGPLLLNSWVPPDQQVGPSCSTGGPLLLNRGPSRSTGSRAPLAQRLALLLNRWTLLLNRWPLLLNSWVPPDQQVGPSCSTGGPLLLNRWAPHAQQVGGPFLLNGWPSCDTCGSSSSSCSHSFTCGLSCCQFRPFC